MIHKTHLRRVRIHVLLKTFWFLVDGVVGQMDEIISYMFWICCVGFSRKPMRKSHQFNLKNKKCVQPTLLDLPHTDRFSVGQRLWPRHIFSSQIWDHGSAKGPSSIFERRAVSLSLELSESHWPLISLLHRRGLEVWQSKIPCPKIPCPAPSAPSEGPSHPVEERFPRWNSTLDCHVFLAFSRNSEKDLHSVSNTKV